jgi:hypothetical protein
MARHPDPSPRAAWMARRRAARELDAQSQRTDRELPTRISRFGTTAGRPLWPMLIQRESRFHHLSSAP